MKIHSLTIKNFRAIEKISIDFTNKLSQPRRVMLIVGPNGSGKTSILDAIFIVVRTSENLKTLKIKRWIRIFPSTTGSRPR